MALFGVDYGLRRQIVSQEGFMLVVTSLAALLTVVTVLVIGTRTPQLRPVPVRRRQPRR